MKLLSVGLYLLLLSACADDIERVKGRNERLLLQFKACADAGGIPMEGAQGDLKECRKKP